MLSVPLLPALSANHETTSLGLAVFLAYPFADLALLASILGLVTITPGVLRGWRWLAGGLVLFAASDIAFSIGAETSVLEQTWLQVGWAVGLMSIAQWVVRSRMRRHPSGGARATRTGSSPSARPTPPACRPGSPPPACSRCS